jgi:hypothetical protein
MDETLFDALIARAELKLTPQERAGLLDASRHLMAMLAALRPPRDVAMEPATTFRPGPAA